jgi:hypothetical protein
MLDRYGTLFLSHIAEDINDSPTFYGMSTYHCDDSWSELHSHAYFINHTVWVIKTLFLNLLLHGSRLNK